MSFALLEESSKGMNTDGKQLQEKLNQYDKDFYDTINFFPESYSLHKLDKNDPRYRTVQKALDQNKSDMYNLYTQVNKTVRKNHDKIQESDVDIDLVRDKRDLLDTELELLESQDIASQQRKDDKVEYYRRQVVEVFYLLAGIGIMGGSIYHLIK